MSVSHAGQSTSVKANYERMEISMDVFLGRICCGNLTFATCEDIMKLDFFFVAHEYINILIIAK